MSKAKTSEAGEQASETVQLPAKAENPALPKGRFAYVARPVLKDGVVDSWDVVEVPKRLAKTQLEAKKESRHKHWKAVRWATEEEVKEYRDVHPVAVNDDDDDE